MKTGDSCSKILGVLLACLIAATLVACERVGKPPAPPPPDEVTPTKPPRELARIGDFSIALAQVEREEDTATLHFAITKVRNTDAGEQTVPVVLVDDHQNKYMGELRVDLRFWDRDTSVDWLEYQYPKKQLERLREYYPEKYMAFKASLDTVINAIPEGFTYTDIVKIDIPSIAPIDWIRLGDKEIAFKDVHFGQPSFRQDFGSFTIKSGTSFDVGKYLTFGIAGPCGEVDGWTLPVTAKNTEYNPISVDVQIGTQFMRGQIRWSQPRSTEVPGSGQKSLRPRIVLSLRDARYGWSCPRMLIIRCSGESAAAVRLMPVTFAQFPPLPERIVTGDYVLKPDGSSKTSLFTRYGDTSAAWSPDGTKLAVSDNVGGLTIMNADGSGRFRLGPGGEPSWSPDGEKIAFRSGKKIYVINTDGSGRTVLAANGTRPAWSPDGRRIAFHHWDGVSGIHVINTDGSGKTMLTAKGEEPAWSPDGRRIAFVGYDDVHGIYVMNADGSARTLIAEGDSYWSPAWSPDGKKIAFVDQSADTYYIINADGSGRTTLCQSWPTSLAWAPATKLIAGTGSEG